MCQPQRSQIGIRIFGLVINRLGEIADFRHKANKGFGKRIVYPQEDFSVSPHPPAPENVNFYKNEYKLAYTPNANMADCSVVARDEVHESEASWA